MKKTIVSKKVYSKPTKPISGRVQNNTVPQRAVRVSSALSKANANTSRGKKK